MKTRPRQGRRRFQLKLMPYGNSYYIGRIEQLERVLSRKPRVIQIDMVGVGEIPAGDWRPYSPATFVTPPFPGYVSGHAAASGAASKILELFTGSNHFGAAATRTAGALTEDEFEISKMQSLDGKAPGDLPHSKEVVLKLPTFSATAEMAALSRLWGGYHIRTDNEEGLKLGRKIAEYSWPIYVSYFKGVAGPHTSDHARN